MDTTTGSCRSQPPRHQQEQTTKRYQNHTSSSSRAERVADATPHSDNGSGTSSDSSTRKSRQRFPGVPSSSHVPNSMIYGLGHWAMSSLSHVCVAMRLDSMAIAVACQQ
eukprot:GHVT01043133.1.p2 GENE.GHVT01043133.1~~GHVT01043133.1.p2  ORF type:complete len:109 (+),score=13.98 GHVT01043133.1:2007-2333(+)